MLQCNFDKENDINMKFAQNINKALMLNKKIINMMSYFLNFGARPTALQKYT